MMPKENLVGELSSSNPWISIWRQPRATIQHIVETNPEKSVILLAALGGFASQLGTASERSYGDGGQEMGSIFVQAAFIGALWGIFSLFFGGFLVHWTGSWIGGKGTAKKIRAALAWGQVPFVCGLLIWIPQLSLVGMDMFTTETPRMDAAGPLVTGLMLTLGILDLVVAIWAFILITKCLGQIQRFSAWRALGNLLLSAVPVILVLIPFALLWWID